MENITKLGNDMWYTLHYITYNNEEPELFLKLFGIIFNCPACKDDYLRDIEDVNTNFNEWLYSYHNKVNVKLNKPFYKYEELKEYGNNPKYVKIINCLKCLSINLDNSITTKLKFKKFLKEVYKLKPFNFNEVDINKIIVSKNMGINKLKYLFT
tara:strand:- start:13575 stop:14036 length:462 start_codon:yes stop_codon:yes gene_type:complete